MKKPRLRAAQRRKVYPKLVARDGEQCRWCGATDDLTVDHILPVAHGGTNAQTNLQLLCYDCNAFKADRDFSDVVVAA